MWTNKANSPTHAKEDRVQTATKHKFSFLDMQMSWSPEGDILFGVFRNKGHWLKYVRQESTHTPGTLCATTSRVLNRLAKITSRNAFIHSEAVDNIYPDHVNSFRKAGLAPPNFTTIVDSWIKQDKKVGSEKEWDVSRKKNRKVYFCVVYSRYFSTFIQTVINRLKLSFNLLWLREQMSYHKFNNLSTHLT